MKIIWEIVVPVLSGIVMAMLTITPPIGWAANVLTCLVVLGNSVVCALNSRRSFVAGSFAGLIIGVLQFGLAIVFWNNFLIHNDELANYFRVKLPNVQLKSIVLIVLVFASLAYGLTIGLLSLLIRAIFNTKYQHREEI